MLIDHNKQTFEAMVRSVFLHGDCHLGSLPLGIGLFVAVVVLVALCAKHFRRAAAAEKREHEANGSRFPARSPLASPRHLVKSIGDNGLPFIQKKKRVKENEDNGNEKGFGEGGLWQKAIIMGERCQPPEFAGAIYYDTHGNQVAELPRSPRAGPLPNYTAAVGSSKA